MRKRIQLWFMSKRDLVEENKRMWALYRDQQDAIRRLTRALEATSAGHAICYVIRTFYDI
jgi:hypothetical protein